MSGRNGVHCYALRRVNPFLGVEQVIEMAQARARSTNGIVWQLELLARAPRAWGSLNQEGDGKRSWHLHALWSEQEGQVNFPQTVPGLDGDEKALCQALIGEIEAKTGSVPFSLRDDRELWLLDGKEKKPLALLFSMLPDALPPSNRLHHWHGCRAGDGTPGHRPFPDTRCLETAVRERAGFNTSTRWITWNSSRTAALSDDGATIDAGDFPTCGLREDWPDAQEMSLVSRYIEWIAPSLLTLPYLPGVQRAWLESSLMKQASSIEYHWRLYPEVLDRAKIQAARVASKIQGSEQQ